MTFDQDRRPTPGRPRPKIPFRDRRWYLDGRRFVGGGRIFGNSILLPSRTPRIIVRVYSLLAKIIVTVLAQVPVRLRLVTSQGPPYPPRSPRAHPSGWTRTQGLSRRDSS